MRPGTAATLVLAALLPAPLLSAPAAANTIATDAAPASPKPPARREVRLGGGLGTTDVGDADGSAGLFVGALGYRRGDLTILGELQYADAGDAGPYFGIRSHFAVDPDRGEMVTCGGPGTRATRPSRLDISGYFVFGIHTGR